MSAPKRRKRDSCKERFSSLARSGGFFFVGIGPVGAPHFLSSCRSGIRFYSVTILPLLRPTSLLTEARTDNGSLVQRVKKSSAETRNVEKDMKERERSYVL